MKCLLRSPHNNVTIPSMHSIKKGSGTMCKAIVDKPVDMKEVYSFFFVNIKIYRRQNADVNAEET